MGYWAQVNESGVVVQTVITPNDDEQDSISWLGAMFGGRWLQTSFNTYGGVHTDPVTHEQTTDPLKAFRKNYAGPGYTYDEERDAFIPPKRFASWVLDEQTCTWVPPVEKPNDGNAYRWDEASVSWAMIPSTSA